MNIFILDENPRIAAEYMCDKHVPKMIVETFQMLGSALRRHGATDDQMPLTKAGKPLKGGYHHHPCTKWAGDSLFNFNWLYAHGMRLCWEYFVRYNKIHSCFYGIDHMMNLDSDKHGNAKTIYNRFPQVDMTPFAQAMPDEYKNSDAVEAYRNYYWNDKQRFAKWEKGRSAPEWWKKMQLTNQVCGV